MQNAAAWGEIIRQLNERDAAISRHIGRVGERIEVELTINFVMTTVGFYGEIHLHVMRDGDSNIFVYRGAKNLGRKGETVRVTARIKSHDEYRGAAQTIIERPTVRAA